jgi:hypothetical protein
MWISSNGQNIHEDNDMKMVENENLENLNLEDFEDKNSKRYQKWNENHIFAQRARNEEKISYKIPFA